MLHGLGRFVAFATLVLMAGMSRPACAQIPAWAPADPAPFVAEPMSAAEPPSPSPPPPAATPPAPPPARLEAPAPAKAVVITEQHGGATAPTDDRSPQPLPAATWYGWQTLAADAATLSIFVTAAAANSGRRGDQVSAPLAWIGALTYEFAPGIVHFAHRHPGRGFASFGLRIGLPLAGIFLGAAAASGCDGNWCEASGAGVGALLGIGGAVAIDAGVFAYDDPAPPKRGAALVPTLAVTRERAVVGLAGTL